MLLAGDGERASMDLLTDIVEKRIQEAMDRGEFECLPGAGTVEREYFDLLVARFERRG
jgi:hypothetical protein